MVFLYFHSLTWQHNCLEVEEVINANCHEVPPVPPHWEGERGRVCPLHSRCGDHRVLTSRYCPGLRSIFTQKVGSPQIIFSPWEALSFSGWFRQDVRSCPRCAHFTSAAPRQKRAHAGMHPSPPCPLLATSPLN